MNAASMPRFFQFCAAIGFVTLFPLYFVYHFSVSQGFIPQFAGGLFGPFSVGFLPLAIVMIGYFTIRHDLRHHELVFVLFMSFLTWVLAWILFNVFSDPNNLGHEQNFQIFLFWIVTFAIGLFYPTRSRALTYIILGLWLTLTVLSILFVESSTLMMGGAERESSTYQGLARSVLLTSFAVLAFMNKPPVRWAVAIFSLVSLFLIGARAELYGFIASYAVIEFVLNRKSLAARMGFFVAMIVVAVMVMNNLDVLGVSRQFEIFDVSRSTSWQARQYLQDFAIMQILENPFFGVYAGHWFLGEGDYAHNFLSAWVSFGIVGFLLYVILCLVSLAASVKALMASPNSEMARLAALLNSAVVLLILVSQPVFWEVPGLAWGLALSASIERRLSWGRGITTSAPRAGPQLQLGTTSDGP